MSKLDEARKKINEVDRQIAELFEQRMDAIRNVVEYKLENSMPVLDPSREKEVLDRNSRLIKNPKYIPYYRELLQNFMDVSKEYQNTFVIHDKIGYQGVEGAFSHIALRRIFDHVEEIKYDSFEEVFKAVENKEIHFGVVPFENSYAGEVGEVLDLIYKHEKCMIQGIYDLKVSQNLIVKRGTKLEEIKKVYSKDQSFWQCAEFLNGRGYELIPYANTALAARHVSMSDEEGLAAIASKEVAELYHLDVICPDINTSKDNTTRFIVIGLDEPQDGNRFSLLFTVKHDAGSLAKIINIIGSYGFNMESIKSKPMRSLPWQYYFYVEIIGNIQDEKTKECIEELKKHCISLRTIGCYTKLGE